MSSVSRLTWRFRDDRNKATDEWQRHPYEPAASRHVSQLGLGEKGGPAAEADLKPAPPEEDAAKLAPERSPKGRGKGASTRLLATGQQGGDILISPYQS